MHKWGTEKNDEKSETYIGDRNKNLGATLAQMAMREHKMRKASQSADASARKTRKTVAPGYLRIVHSSDVHAEAVLMPCDVGSYIKEISQELQDLAKEAGEEELADRLHLVVLAAKLETTQKQNLIRMA